MYRNSVYFRAKKKISCKIIIIYVNDCSIRVVRSYLSVRNFRTILHTKIILLRKLRYQFCPEG